MHAQSTSNSVIEWLRELLVRRAEGSGLYVQETLSVGCLVGREGWSVFVTNEGGGVVVDRGVVHFCCNLFRESGMCLLERFETKGCLA